MWKFYIGILLVIGEFWVVSVMIVSFGMRFEFGLLSVKFYLECLLLLECINEKLFLVFCLFFRFVGKYGVLEGFVVSWKVGEMI